MPARRRDGAGREAAEACARELHEETGLQGHVTRLIGIYTNPHLRVECTDGDRIQPVACSFEVAVTGGELTLSDETTCAGRLLYPGRVLGTRAERLPENHRGWSKRPAQGVDRGCRLLTGDIGAPLMDARVSQ